MLTHPIPSRPIPSSAIPFLPPSLPLSPTVQVARGASSCALSLMRGSDYYIKQLDHNLSIRAGVGSGIVTGMRVGTSERWEFVLTGDPLRQVDPTRAL